MTSLLKVSPVILAKRGKTSSGALASRFVSGLYVATPRLSNDPKWSWDREGEESYNSSDAEFAMPSRKPAHHHFPSETPILHPLPFHVSFNHQFGTFHFAPAPRRGVYPHPMISLDHARAIRQYSTTRSFYSKASYHLEKEGTEGYNKSRNLPETERVQFVDEQTEVLYRARELPDTIPPEQTFSAYEDRPAALNVNEDLAGPNPYTAKHEATDTSKLVDPMEMYDSMATSAFPEEHPKVVSHGGGRFASTKEAFDEISEEIGEKLTISMAKSMDKTEEVIHEVADKTKGVREAAGETISRLKDEIQHGMSAFKKAVGMSGEQASKPPTDEEHQFQTHLKNTGPEVDGTSETWRGNESIGQKFDRPAQETVDPYPKPNEKVSRK